MLQRYQLEAAAYKDKRSLLSIFETFVVKEQIKIKRE
jgi:hypothetical protein